MKTTATPNTTTTNNNNNNHHHNGTVNNGTVKPRTYRQGPTQERLRALHVPPALESEREVVEGHGHALGAGHLVQVSLSEPLLGHLPSLLRVGYVLLRFVPMLLVLCVFPPQRMKKSKRQERGLRYTVWFRILYTSIYIYCMHREFWT